MLRFVLPVLALVPLAARAENPLTPEEFEARVTGRTLTYSADGMAYGADYPTRANAAIVTLAMAVWRGRQVHHRCPRCQSEYVLVSAAGVGRRRRRSRRSWA